MQSNYDKYLKYKTKYLQLKQHNTLMRGVGIEDSTALAFARGGSKCEYPILEHGIGSDILTFMRILSSGHIYSPQMAHTRSLNFLSVHVATTGGDNTISMSIPKTLSSETYSSTGITFLIDTNGLSCVDKRTPIVGETYIENEISLKQNLRAIYLPSTLGEKRVNDLDICRLDTGSTNITERLKYLFGANDELEFENQNINTDLQFISRNIKLIKQAYDSVYAKARELHKMLVKKDPTRPIKEIQAEVNRYMLNTYKKISLACSKYLFAKLVFDSVIAQNIVDNFTLRQFVQYFIDLHQLNVQIVNTL